MWLTHRVLDMEDSSELGNYYKTVAKETKEARQTTKTDNPSTIRSIKNKRSLWKRICRLR